MIPVKGLWVVPLCPNSGVVVLPIKTTPDSFNLAVTGASSFQSEFLLTVFEPLIVGQPLVNNKSLTAVGTPSISLF